MNRAGYIQRHYERLFAMAGIAASYRLPHPTEPAPAVLELPVTVVAAQTDAEREGSDALTVQSRIRDWLIAAADLVHEGNLIEPAETHRIVLPPDADVPWSAAQWYRPLAPTDGEPVWRYSDSARTVLRIHSREGAADQLMPEYEPPTVDPDPGGVDS